MSAIAMEGLGQPVEVGQIDGELKKLWEADDANTNASLMNLLIYSEDPHQLVPNSEIAQSLTEEHACRAMLIGMDRKNTEPSVEAWITAHCHLAHGKKSICSEQVSFLLSGRAVGRLRNTVFAHLNSDLPLVFWWQGELSDLFEEKLYQPLDRLIFDSAAWSNPIEGFSKIEQARQDVGCHMVTQDLAWTRSFYFRLAFAGIFDDPAAQSAFPSIKKVTLKARQDQRTTALLTIAWMAEMAKWVRFSGLHFQSQEGLDIEVDLQLADDGPALTELIVEGDDFLVKITREWEAKHLCQHIEVGSHRLHRMVPADPESPRELVAEQLSRGGKNSLFLRVLPGFLELL
ncbi:MAG: glucose-6-phosphate dehydrogenase assembly protein OpcA [Akkermansiaceae bacterium]